MEKGWKRGQMERSMKDNMLLGRKKGSDVLCGQMARDITASSRIIALMDKGYTHGAMERHMTENGPITRCMVKDSLCGRMAGNIVAIT